MKTEETAMAAKSFGHQVAERFRWQLVAGPNGFMTRQNAGPLRASSFSDWPCLGKAACLRIGAAAGAAATAVPASAVPERCQRHETTTRRLCAAPPFSFQGLKFPRFPLSLSLSLSLFFARLH